MQFGLNSKLVSNKQSLVGHENYLASARTRIQSPRRLHCSVNEIIAKNPLTSTAYEYDLHDEKDKILYQQLQTVKKQEQELRKQVEDLEVKLLSRRQSKLRQQLNQERSVDRVGAGGAVTGNGAGSRKEFSDNGQDLKALPKSKKRKKKRSSQFSAARANIEGSASSNGNSNAISIPEYEVILPLQAESSAESIVTSSETDQSVVQEGHSNGAQIDESMVSIDGDLQLIDPESCLLPKPIFVVSDCTGESAAHTVRAALGQFELCYQLTAPANMVIFRFQEDQDKMYEVVHQAQVEGALIVYTLVDPLMVKAIKTASKLYNVKIVDMWSSLLDEMESHLNTVRSGIPLHSPQRRSELPADYFRMIEAVEFTRKMDDGANPQNWHSADLLILGVSRSGKTPLSIYLGQRGYKTANLPLVPNCPLPKQLFEIDERRVIGLLIDPTILSQIRKTRKGVMGVEDDPMDYDNLRKIKEEIAWAKKLYDKNPNWVVMDVTLRSVEETAARILKAQSQRFGDEHPLWADHYSLASIHR